MKALKVFLLFVLVATPCYGKIECAEPKPYENHKEFYETAGGTVAFLDGGKNALTHLVLPQSGSVYRLPRGKCWFRVNHRTDSEPQEAYLGVTVCVIFRENRSSKKPYNLFRSKGTWDTDKDRGIHPKLPNMSGPPNYKKGTVAHYFKAHEQGSLPECDKILDWKWHVSAGSGRYQTWDYREKWGEARPRNVEEFIRELGIREGEQDEIAITAQILHFTSSKKPEDTDKSERVDFNFNADNALGAYLCVFSPLDDDSYNKSFYIKFY